MTNTKSNRKILVETSRPTMYRSLKYWGKKPHNIWGQLIIQNTNVGDIVYDPFAGSGLTFFESIKYKRKPIIADINPLTLFLVQLYSKSYNIRKLIKRYEEIENIVSTSTLYKSNYKTICSKCGSVVDVYNYRWENKYPHQLSYKCTNCGATITENNSKNIYNEVLGYWKPSENISNYSSVSQSSLKHFEGNDIADIWTKRNLEVLSQIFHLIKASDIDIRDPLMFAFLQSVHLTTKMCALRSEKTNRPLSTSWGRPAYMYLNKHMEQNPLLQFKRSIFEKNGVIKALSSRDEYLPKYEFSTKIQDIDDVSGVVLLKDSKNIIDITADFIIMDPPYGSIIQYGELSTIWNVWLENYDDIYKTNLDSEIIVKSDKDYSQYTNDMTQVLSNCKNILNNNANIILTFNSNNLKDWDSIISSINAAGLNIVDKYLQHNLRTSEANVSGTSDMAISDYYFVLNKNNKMFSYNNEAKEYATYC